MSNVFVIGSDYKPLNPIHPARARLLLTQRKASVYRRYPFTIILKRVVEQPEVQPLRLKLDPGSKTTGIALVNDTTRRVTIVLDRTMLDHDPLNYHPLENDRTTAIAPADLLRFIAGCGHRPRIIDLDAVAR